MKTELQLMKPILTIAAIVIVFTLSMYFYSRSLHPRFLDKTHLTENIEALEKSNPKVILQLRKSGITGDTERRLQYFFYTNNTEKARQLSAALCKLNYSVMYRRATPTATEYVITGMTIKIMMSENAVNNWTKEMCWLGYKYDCDFDGWETDVKQTN